MERNLHKGQGKWHDAQITENRSSCGADEGDYDWTKTVLDITHEHASEEVHGFMDGLSLHYYVVPGTWEKKGSATEFDEDDWYLTLVKAYRMDELVVV